MENKNIDYGFVIPSLMTIMGLTLVYPYPKAGILFIILGIVLLAISYFKAGGGNNPILYRKTNLFEFISYATKIGEARINFVTQEHGSELFELLSKHGMKVLPNPFGREVVRKSLTKNPKVFDICKPFISIIHVIDKVPKYFDGFGEETTESDVFKAEILIDFQLSSVGEQELVKLLKLKTEVIKEEPIEDDKNTIDELFRKAFAFKGSSEYKKFFSFIAKFNHYARYNSMLVYIQNPNVTFFGTSYFWRTKFQRTINENAKPHIILAPGGPVILAYDIFDTSGEQSPAEFLKNGLKLKLFDVKGEFKKEFLTTLKAYATKYGIKVTHQPMSYFQGGAVTTYITKKLEIYLRDGNDERQHFSTLCHELAHIFLGHTGHKVLITENKKARVNLPERTKLSLKQEELEAETVNFLICKKLGLETKSMEYLAGYIDKEEDWSNFSYELVIKVADRLQGLIN